MTSLAYSHSDVILFDGVCSLCSNAVQFIIERDPDKRYKFASLQSGFGQQVLKNLNLDSAQLQSIIVLKGNNVYRRSDAALEIARNLSGAWPLFYVFKIIPRFLRDPLYNIVARYRYSWFGKMEACWLPTPQLKARFIDS
jgi:predicted DCC family thiol-disulfide oxidoreductase YuxK